MQIFSTKTDKAKQTLVEQIILDNYNRYYRMAYSYVHNDMDACDIVQNGAYKAIRSSRTLKNSNYAETWVYRIMINECFRFLNQPKHISYESISEENGGEIAYQEDHYLELDLYKALMLLSDKDKAVILLKYFEDRTLEEIADILDENINTIKSRLYRGMKKLRKFLSDEGGKPQNQNNRTGR